MPLKSKAGSRQHVDGVADSELRYLILAAQREGSRALSRQLSSLQLTPAQSEILLVLQQYGPLTLKELGELVVCEAGSPSRIVDVLVKRNLVMRTPDPRDRRAVVLELADEGARLVPQLRGIEKELDEQAAAIFTHEETLSIATALKKFLAPTESGPVLERRFGQLPPS